MLHNIIYPVRYDLLLSCWCILWTAIKHKIIPKLELGE